MVASLVNKSMLFFIVTTFVILQLMVGVVSGFFLDTKVTLHNSLVVPVIVHCKDKNHDDGFHVLNSRDNITIKFKRAFLIRKTLWFCSFKWEKEFHYFDIYDQKRHTCTHCIWRIRTYGLCLDTYPDLICFPWNNINNFTPIQKRMLISEEENSDTILQALK
ncbi:putative plant self-incompatibility S1 [Lupinus albus]|uniref:S-protein homolog n=1 Tax=Lupinus albus TaxID=3870 RepID=A0A6A4N6H8_LUPAL|nr:putative plant self-incompatibility S1 [Lupinus albus]